MTDGPRVRIAPSPTGYFHVGTGRTALFNWLFARQQGGTFVLRIEDTDTARNKPSTSKGSAGHELVGLDWDGDPTSSPSGATCTSSAIDQLLEAGAVYACDCTPDAMPGAGQGAGRAGYDGHCRDRGLPIGRAAPALPDARRRPTSSTT